jgi:diacylglycerol O-acyltransferase
MAPDGAARARSYGWPMTRTRDRLTALDGTFLELEDGDPCTHMHLGAILVLGPRPDGSVPTLEQVRAQLGDHVKHLPRYRERLAHPGPGTIGWQRWVPDEHFDVARHVIPGTLPAPGGWEELFEWAGDYFSARLDREMPLWQVAFVDGLGDDHWALVAKLHHCLTDGLGAVDAATLLLDGIAEALGVARSAISEGPADAPHPGAAGRAIRAGLHLVAHPLDVPRRAAALADLAVREELLAAPESSINVPIGPRRLLRAVTLELDEARQIRQVFGGTVNDVVLYAACAGLRALLRARGEELPVLGLRAMVPVDVRSGDDPAGNHISSLFVDLPVDEPDAVSRYQLVCQASAAAKRSSQPLGAETLLDLGALAPPVVHHLLAPVLAGRRLFNLTVTNVPGPPLAMTALGAPLKSVWPLVPLAPDHAVGIAVLSYAGRLMFGVCADRDSVPDVDVLAVGMAEALQVLHRRAAGGEPLPAR